MKALRAAGLSLFAMAVHLAAGTVPEVEGCKDPSVLKRIAGCVITSCAAKERDNITLQLSAGKTQLVDASIDSVTYSCPAWLSPQDAARDLNRRLRAASYQVLNEDTQDANSAVGTARKGTQWIQLNAESVEEGTTYSVAVVETGPKKVPRPETCSGPSRPVLEHVCTVVECNSRFAETVKMRTSSKGETALQGPVVETTMICAKSTPSQIFDSAVKELRDDHFEILFEDRAHVEDSWITGRSGKRWVELTNSQEGDAMLYLLTVLPSADMASEPKPRTTETGLTSPAPGVPTAAVHSESGPAAIGTPKKDVNVADLTPEPPKPEPDKKAERVSPAEPVRTAINLAPPEPNVPAPTVIPRPPQVPSGPVTPPKILAQVPMVVPDSLKKSILGDVVITLNLEIDATGQVTKASLAGKTTKNVQRLESAAVEAVRRWKFEPARQGDQPIAGHMTVKVKFEGEVIRTNLSTIH